MTSDIISNPYAGPGEWPPAWLDPWAKRAAAFGVVGGNPADRLRELADRILDVNRRVNLTSDRAPCVFWSRHVEDAVRAAGALEAALGRPVTGDAILDVGSGGGIPGLVWATLWPAARVGLIEATGKKARFLREAAHALGLRRIEVFADRAETLGRDPALRERWDVVTARALAPLPVLLELTMPFVRIGGWLAAVKGASVDAEIAAAIPACARLGGGSAAPSLVPYERSDGVSCRLCVYRKVFPTPAAYPRRPGVPARHPLIPDSMTRQGAKTPR